MLLVALRKSSTPIMLKIHSESPLIIHTIGIGRVQRIHGTGQTVAWTHQLGAHYTRTRQASKPIFLNRDYLASFLDATLLCESLYRRSRDALAPLGSF